MSRRVAGLLLVAPALAVVALAGTGLVYAARGSVADGLGGGWNTTAYRELLTDPVIRESLLTSLCIASVSTAGSALLALGAVGAVSTVRGARRALDAVARATLAVPHVLAAAAFALLLAGSGLASRLGHAVGLTGAPADFPVLVAGEGQTAVLLTYAWKEAPFIALLLLAAHTPAVRDLETAARTLGAGRLQRLLRVTWPLLAPALVEACLLVFAFTFAAFEVPALLGPSAPRALPVEAVELYRSVELADRPRALALAIVTGAVVALAALAAAVISRRLLRARTLP
ncbi:ABC transporter permease subunit [Streptomyces ovatisporus]|uniref:ABC transporter permease subunit n=1 Tax=Streptomyces ovatisporus TaxID=1128682 RepID=A0ABV9AAP4_9ACTN